MANESELTGMHLLKILLSKDRAGDSMSPEEREWMERQKKASHKYKIRIEGSGGNQDQNYGSDG